MYREGFTSGTAVAVIGLSCRVPGIDSPAALWQLVCEGGSTVSDLPAARRTLPGSGYDRAADEPVTGSFFTEPHLFDHEFFQLSATEAATMDPHQRLMLELAWEAIEDARIPASALRETRVGVHIGATSSDFVTVMARLDRRTVDHTVLTGLNRGVIANRISHALGLTGPSLTVDSAQSSSLVAVHLAAASIRSGECDIALAGGGHLNLAHDSELAMRYAGVLSPDGQCFTFDSRANGIVRGEGGGLVVLKALDAALAAGDHIYAVLPGSAVNNDGSTPVLTDPREDAQADVIRAAIDRAGVTPDMVDYVELHGTGTRVGDPIEARALGAVFGRGRDGRPPVAVGSVKTNIGHCEGAAGILGLIKVVTAVEHGVLPPARNFENPHPAVDLAALGLEVQTRPEPWESRGAGRLAGVSSFGIGGTNCHVLVAEAPCIDTALPDAGIELPWSPILLSAQTVGALRLQAARLTDLLDSGPDIPISAIARALVATRETFAVRAAVTSSSAAGVRAGLAEIASGMPGEHSDIGLAVESDRGPVFVFPGQGGQWLGMGRALLAESPVFRAVVETCDRIVRSRFGWSILEVLHAADRAADTEDSSIVQPTLFAVMVGLTRVWESWGVVPAAVIGHSQGEIAAAYIAGCLTLEDALVVICVRAGLTEGLAADGAMLSVRASAEAVANVVANLGAGVCVAVSNSPDSVVLSGDRERLGEIAGELEGAGIRARWVAISYASHSDKVACLAEPLLDRIGGITPTSGAIPVFSTVTGGRIPGTALDAGYWYRNLREQVRFHGAVEELLRAGYTHFVEVSPHPVLTARITETAQSRQQRVAVTGSLLRGSGDIARLTASAVRFHVQGGRVDWLAGVLKDASRQHVSLPTYAFQRRACWPAAFGGGHREPVGPQGAQLGGPHGSEPVETSGALLQDASLERVREVVLSQLEAIAGDSTASIDLDAAFQDIGVGSALSVELVTRLNTIFGTRVSSGAVFDYPTPAALADHLRGAVLAHLDASGDVLDNAFRDLERYFERLPADGAGRVVAERLTALLARHRDDQDVGRDIANDIDIESVSQDELLTFIDTELRNS